MKFTTLIVRGIPITDSLFKREGDHSMETEVLPTGPNAGLLQALNLSAQMAGGISGQPTSYIVSGFAESDKRRPVPKYKDIVSICHVLQLMGASYNETAVMEHIHNRFGDADVTKTAEAFARMSAPVDLASFSELWFMTPDVKHLAEDGRFEFFFDLLKFPSKLTLFTGGPLEEERLKKHLSEEVIAAKGESLTFASDSLFGAWPSTLLTEPHGETLWFDLGSTGFLRAPFANGKELVKIIEERERMTPLEKLLAE